MGVGVGVRRSFHRQAHEHMADIEAIECTARRAFVLPGKVRPFCCDYFDPKIFCVNPENPHLRINLTKFYLADKDFFFRHFGRVMSSEVLKKQIDNWLTWDPRDETKAEIQALVDKEDWVELKDRLEKRIAFGTAGLSLFIMAYRGRTTWSHEGWFCSHERFDCLASVPGVLCCDNSNSIGPCCILVGAR